MIYESIQRFNKDMTCRGFQYEEGKEYETDKASLCNEGFHACKNPIDCFNYYSPKVKGGLHSVIALQYWVDNKLKCIKFKEVDGEEIKADTFYMLQNGELTECEED